MRVGKMGSTILWNGEYADYVRKGGDIVSIEAYPDPENTPRETELEIWAGREIVPSSVVIYRAETEAPRPALLTAAPIQQTQSRTVEVVRQTTAPIERRHNAFTDSAQHKVLIGGGIAASAILVIVLLILFI